MKGFGVENKFSLLRYLEKNGPWEEKSSDEEKLLLTEKVGPEASVQTLHGVSWLEGQRTAQDCSERTLQPSTRTTFFKQSKTPLYCSG